VYNNLTNLLATVEHRAGLSLIGGIGIGLGPGVLEVKDGLRPDAGVGAGGTGRDDAVHGGAVIKAMRPAAVLQVRVSVLEAGHAAVVQEAVLLHHGPLLVAANLEEGRADADNVLLGHVGVLHEHLAHVSDLGSPALDIEVLPVVLVVHVPAHREDSIS
jgi:hypothetical protein